MKTILLSILLLGQSTPSREMTVQGFVYDRSRVLATEGMSPAEAGVPNAPVLLELHLKTPDHPQVELARGKTDEWGRYEAKVRVPDLPSTSGAFRISGVATHEGADYRFDVTPEGRFEAAVYETTTALDDIRIIRNAIFLDVMGQPADRVDVTEVLHLVNGGKKAFQGIRPNLGMPRPLLATIRTSVRTHRLRAGLSHAETSLDAFPVEAGLAGISGSILPTGPEGDDLIIAYTLHLGPGGRASITRPVYFGAEVVNVFYPRTGVGVDPGKGFSDAEPAPGEMAAKYYVRERRDVRPGEELMIEIDLAPHKFYWVIGSFGLVFLLAVFLAYLAARRASKAVDAADTIPNLDGPAAPSLPLDVGRLLGKIEALEGADAQDSLREGKRQAYVEEILEALKRSRTRRGSSDE
ncbi:MAG: hypothetical protein O7H41_06595 [Planctomycetota bacterium]|nr:hypothetical protein [Planctomycetota bacterium]